MIPSTSVLVNANLFQLPGTNYGLVVDSWVGCPSPYVNCHNPANPVAAGSAFNLSDPSTLLDAFQLSYPDGYATTNPAFNFTITWDSNKNPIVTSNGVQLTPVKNMIQRVDCKYLFSISCNQGNKLSGAAVTQLANFLNLTNSSTRQVTTSSNSGVLIIGGIIILILVLLFLYWAAKKSAPVEY